MGSCCAQTVQDDTINAANVPTENLQATKKLEHVLDGSVGEQPLPDAVIIEPVAASSKASRNADQQVELAKDEPASPSSPPADQLAAPNSPPQSATMGPQQRYFERFLAGRPAQPDRPGNLPRSPDSQGCTLDEFIAKKSDLLKKLQDMESDDGWVRGKDAALGTQVLTKQDPGNDLLSFKARTTITLQQGHVFRDLAEHMDPGLRPQWDPLCAEGRVVQSFNPFYRISYFALDPPNPIISKRDACMTGYFAWEEDGSLYIFTEQSHAVPLQEGFVRVGWKYGGYILRPSKENPATQIDVTFTGCADPNGWIPLFVKKLVAPKQADALVMFKRGYESGTLKLAS